MGFFDLFKKKQDTSATAEQQAAVKALADQRYAELCELYDMVKVTSK